MKNSADSAFRQQLAAMNRRHFLKGLGATIALPAFSSLASNRLVAARAAPIATRNDSTG